MIKGKNNFFIVPLNIIISFAAFSARHIFDVGIWLKVHR